MIITFEIKALEFIKLEYKLKTIKQMNKDKHTYSLLWQRKKILSSIRERQKISKAKKKTWDNWTDEQRKKKITLMTRKEILSSKERDKEQV